MSLNSIGIMYGTDKSSLRNDLLGHYDALFDKWRHQHINVIEIGIHTGASLRMWQAYFDAATIIGLDIEPGCRMRAGGRIKVEIGSQADAEFLHDVAAKFPPTLAIDDGSHLPEHQIFTFEQLFPTIEPGGCYVVEDLSRGVSQTHGGISPIDYFANLQRQLMEQAPWDPSQEISRIDILPRAVALWKKVAVEYALDLSMIDDLVNRSGRSESLLYFSEYVDRRLGDLPRSLEIALQAVAANPGEPWFHLRVVEIFRKTGDIKRAISQSLSENIKRDYRVFAA
jgi:hypothetical protein